MTAALARVGDLAEQVRGVSYAKDDASATARQGYLPVLRAGNVTDEGLDFDDLVFVPAGRISSRQRIRKHDVVIVASSGSLEVVGKAARAVADYEGGFGAFCKVLRPGSDIDPVYFGHFFKTRNYRQRISALAEGININNLRSEHLDGLQVPMPPLSEQRWIAAILDKADALRAKRRAALAELDALTQAIFLDMFGDPATNTKGWPVQALQEVVKKGTIVTYGIVQAGKEVPGGVPYIRTGDIVDGRILTAGLRHADPAIATKFRRSRLEAGDIVMSIRATVGTTALVPGELDGANLTQGTGRISPGDSTDRLYLLNFLRTAGAQQWIALQIKGATFREITLTRLRELPVAVPPIELQCEFARRATVVEKLGAAQLASLTQLDALFAALQHRAFRGEL